MIGRPDSIITDFLPDVTRLAFERLPHWTTISRTYGIGQARVGVSQHGICGILRSKDVQSYQLRPFFPRRSGPLQKSPWWIPGRNANDTLGC